MNKIDFSNYDLMTGRPTTHLFTVKDLRTGLFSDLWTEQYMHLPEYITEYGTLYKIVKKAYKDSPVLSYDLYKIVEKDDRIVAICVFVAMYSCDPQDMTKMKWCAQPAAMSYYPTAQDFRDIAEVIDAIQYSEESSEEFMKRNEKFNKRKKKAK